MKALYRLALGGGAVFLGLQAWLLTGFSKPDWLMPHGVMMVFGVLGPAALAMRPGMSGAHRSSIPLLLALQVCAFLTWFHGSLHLAALAAAAMLYAPRSPALAVCAVLSFWWPLPASLLALHLVAWTLRKQPRAIFAALFFGLGWLHPEPLSTVHLMGLGGVALLATPWPAWPVLAAALALRLGPTELWPLAAGLGAVALLTSAAAGPPSPWLPRPPSPEPEAG